MRLPPPSTISFKNHSCYVGAQQWRTHMVLSEDLSPTPAPSSGGSRGIAYLWPMKIKCTHPTWIHVTKNNKNQLKTTVDRLGGTSPCYLGVWCGRSLEARSSTPASVRHSENMLSTEGDWSVIAVAPPVSERSLKYLNYVALAVLELFM